MITFVATDARGSIDKAERVIRQFTSKVFRERQKYIEMLAAAYMKETNIPARHCQFVEQVKGDGSVVMFFMDKRNTTHTKGDAS